jgi:inositol-phosphate phosphatase/L-galactose 1-phosphate phosphatase/histidinol-phosphatase
MYSKELELAKKLSDTASIITLPYFRKHLKATAKEDLTPVTIADREAEQAMRALIEETYPDHGILGEEFEDKNIDAKYVWALDPIDGTKSFITGSPLFGTLVSLLKDGYPIIGIINMPALKERWVGCEGKLTSFNGKSVRVRPCKDISEAWLYATSPHMFLGDDFTAFERVRKQVYCTLYGTDCYAYGLLANGTCDLIVEASMGIYDFCALVPIINGAGGYMVDWHGKPLGLKSDGRVIAAGGLALVETVRSLLDR